MVVFDVVECILLRSAATDLTSWKVVCKSWYSLISSPRFAQAHLNHTCNNNDNELGHVRIAMPSYWKGYLIEDVSWELLPPNDYEMKHEVVHHMKMIEYALPKNKRMSFFCDDNICLSRAWKNVIDLLIDLCQALYLRMPGDQATLRITRLVLKHAVLRNGPCQGARMQWKFQSGEAACTFVKLK
ncbi:F-box protein CPR30-like protein isoform X1, partial [Tanacetum coccineum]